MQRQTWHWLQVNRKTVQSKHDCNLIRQLCGVHRRKYSDSHSKAAYHHSFLNNTTNEKYLIEGNFYLVIYAVWMPVVNIAPSHFIYWPWPIAHFTEKISNWNVVSAILKKKHTLWRITPFILHFNMCVCIWVCTGHCIVHQNPLTASCQTFRNVKIRLLRICCFN